MSKFYLKEITSKIGSGATPTGGKDAYCGGNYALIRSQNVLDMSFSKNGLAYINEEQAKKLNNVSVEKGDILFNITGDSICRCCIVPEEVLPARVNQHVAIIRTEEVNSRYLMYYLQYLKPYLMSICGNGSSRNALTKENLENLIVEVSDSADDIAKSLSVIDRKIENNNNICIELESLTKTLYDYWFLQYEFPNEEGKPYKSSGGHMEWNTELKSEIPKGWSFKQLNEITTFENGDRGKNYPSGKDFIKEGVPFISGGAIKNNRIENSELRYISEEKFNSLRAGKAKMKDILLTLRGSLAKCVYNPYNKLAIASALVIVRPKQSINNTFLYHLLTSTYMTQLYKNYNNGSVQANLSVDMMKSFKCLVPSMDVLKKWEEIVGKIDETRLRIEKENQELISLRDFLLPLLMTGQVGFNEK